MAGVDFLNEECVVYKRNLNKKYNERNMNRANARFYSSEEIRGKPRMFLGRFREMCFQ